MQGRRTDFFSRNLREDDVHRVKDGRDQAPSDGEPVSHYARHARQQRVAVAGLDRMIRSPGTKEDNRTKNKKSNSKKRNMSTGERRLRGPVGAPGSVECVRVLVALPNVQANGGSTEAKETADDLGDGGTVSLSAPRHSAEQDDQRSEVSYEHDQHLLRRRTNRDDEGEGADPVANHAHNDGSLGLQAYVASSRLALKGRDATRGRGHGRPARAGRCRGASGRRRRPGSVARGEQWRGFRGCQGMHLVVDVHVHHHLARLPALLAAGVVDRDRDGHDRRSKVSPSQDVPLRDLVSRGLDDEAARPRGERCHNQHDPTDDRDLVLDRGY
eukprot:scaffold1123_cov253-Pinguiococcus_pyrenoidosus.AAC.7